MKTISSSIQVLCVTILLAGIMLIASCDGGGGDPTPEQTKQEEVTAMLTGKTWKLQSLTVGGVDRTSMFTGLTLQFTSSSFTATNGGAVWPASSTWTFTSTEATAIRRADGVDANLEATATSLKLTLTWTKTTLGPGRTSSVAGVHVFTFGL